MKWEAMKRTFSKLPRAARRKMLHAIPAQYELIACYAGKTEPVHEKILEKNYQQYEIPVKGQCDILITGIPDISPYNVYSALNPLLVQVMALGISLQHVPQQAAAQKRRCDDHHASVL